MAEEKVKAGGPAGDKAAKEKNDLTPKEKRESVPVSLQGGVSNMPLFTLCMFVAWICALLVTSPERMDLAKQCTKLETWRRLPDTVLSHFRKPWELTFPQWVTWEEKEAFKGLMRNVNPPGTLEGVIVASPSRQDPDYWYTWTRDSALVMRPIVDRVSAGEKRHNQRLLEYVRANREIMRKQTVIGGFDDGGLGEVKYHVDYEPFKGEWGRPQQDGPALRASTMVQIANFMLDKGGDFGKNLAKTLLYDSKLPTRSLIKGDLEHLTRTWKEPCFDLWEEVSGSHFYTMLAISTALKDGSVLARQLSDPGAADYYTKVASEVDEALESFWDAQKGIIRVTKDHAVGRDSDENAHAGDDTYGKVSELDTAVILAILHSGRDTEWFGQGRHADKVLSTLQHLRMAFAQTYPINKNLTVPALGRYPEDKYDGYGLSEGNPWYLCTLAAAEFVYLSAVDLLRRDTALHITTESFAFYSSLVPSLQVGVAVEPHSAEMRKLASAMGNLGDSFVHLVRRYARPDGRMPEQFNLVTGQPQGAHDLTWSYAAFLTASKARKTLVAVLRSA